mgnify:CR=1 FL=1
MEHEDRDIPYMTLNPKAGKPPRRPSKEGLAPRACALDAFGQILGRGRSMDDALNGHDGFSRLIPSERAFARTLIRTTLRHWGQADDLIKTCLERPLPKRATGVKDLLRLGIAQLLFMDTAAHAAVGSTVALAQTQGHGPHKGLINAILRRLGRDGKAMVQAQDAARLNTPDWLWESWTQTYGEKTCRLIAEAHMNEPALDITPKGDVEKWAQALGAEVLPTGTLRLVRAGPVTKLPGFAEGAWWVQDAASALPARLLGDIKGKRVLDLCAAPGGKTAQIAAAGARVTALDRSEKRLARLRENLTRLNLEAETVIADAARWKPAEPADAVLLDAPCSSTGTIRRHPDIAYLKRPEDVTKLAQVQERLLEAALDMVRPGGILIYATCSLQPEEGLDRVRALIVGGAPVERLSIAVEELGGMAELITPDGDLRSLPYHLGAQGGMDGFYCARLKKR